MKKGWYKELPGRVFYAAFIAGVATFAMWAGADVVSAKAFGIAFGVPFIAEMRKFVDLKKQL